MTDTLRSIVESWKVERDAKCEDCKNGLVLGRHGCHFMDDGEESYSTGNCKAWPLSRRIQQMEALLAEYEKVDLVKRLRTFAAASENADWSDGINRSADELETWLAVHDCDYFRGFNAGRREAALEEQAKEKP